MVMTDSTVGAYSSGKRRADARDQGAIDHDRLAVGTRELGHSARRPPFSPSTLAVTFTR